MYFPVGKIGRRGLTIAHESWFDVGAVLPELTGYEAGGVWVKDADR